MQEITEDHSLVEELGREGPAHTRAGRRASRNVSIITRALGRRRAGCKVDVYPLELATGRPGTDLLRRPHHDGPAVLDIARILRRERDPRRAGDAVRRRRPDRGASQLLSTITFIEFEGKTTVSVEWTPLNATEAEVEFFGSMAESMNQGWGGTLDKLAEYVKEVE